MPVLFSFNFLAIAATYSYCRWANSVRPNHNDSFDDVVAALCALGWPIFWTAILLTPQAKGDRPANQTKDNETQLTKAKN